MARVCFYIYSTEIKLEMRTIFYSTAKMQFSSKCWEQQNSFKLPECITQKCLDISSYSLEYALI